MSDKYENYEIMFAVYGSEDGAAGAVESLKAMDKAKTIDIIDAATLVKDADGNASVKQESLPSVKKGLGVGALIGGAVGLIFPPSIIASAAIGAGLGAGGAKIAKSALESDDLKQAADSLDPGSSAFIAVVENTWVAQVQDTIAGYQSLAEHTLDAEASGIIGSISNDSEAVLYGSAASDSAATQFAVATDGDTIVGQATTAAIADDGSVIVDQIEGIVATDADGNVGGIVSETVAVVDADGNAAVAQAVDAGVISAPEDDDSDSATSES
jgi:uncharacterized membrane protein